MKKTLLLIIILFVVLSFNANAGENVNKNIIFNDFKPKTEISDHKNTKELKTIQKLLNTKIGRLIIKKTIKRLQKQIMKPQKHKNSITTLITIIFVLSILLLLGGIVIMIWGNFLLGIILAIAGLFIFGSIIFFLNLIGNAFRHN